jgi:glycoside/pentoside/hexuronide:cation symporter, GPH family
MLPVQAIVLNVKLICFDDNHLLSLLKELKLTTSQSHSLQEEQVPLKSRISVSLADAMIQIMQNLAAGGALTYYFTRIRGLDPARAGIVWLLFGIWNAINDPLFGFISDRTQHKLGRRIPYIRFGAPLMALSFVLLWIDIPGMG